MNHAYNKRLVAKVLFLSLILQNCTNTFRPSIPHKLETSRQHYRSLQLVNEELMAEGGHIVVLHEEQGALQAEVIMNAPSGFSKTYTALPVYTDGNTVLTDLARLNKKHQKDLIQVHLRTSNQPGYVYIGKRGILGGMLEGDNYQEKEAEKEKSNGWDLEELLAYAQSGNREAQFKLGERSYEAWQQHYNEEDLQEAKKWLGKAAVQGHKVAIALLEELNLPSLIEEPKTIKYTCKGKEKVNSEREESKNEFNIQQLIECVRKGDIEAQFELGKHYYLEWTKYDKKEDYDEAIEHLTRAKENGHMLANSLLNQLISKEDLEIDKAKDVVTTQPDKNKPSHFSLASPVQQLQEDSLQIELKRRIIAQLAQPAYHQRIKLELYKQLTSSTLSENQRAKLFELIRIITPSEKKLRLGGSHEIREAFRAKPSQNHNLFNPLRMHIAKLASYKQEFDSTPIVLLLEELIQKHQAFISSLTEQIKTLGSNAPLKLFEAKPLLQGEDLDCYQVGTKKAYKLACYNLHEYEYVRSNSSGLSIGRMQGGVYFKVDNGTGLLRPAKEHAVYSLYQILGLSHLVSPTYLVSMNGLSILPPDIGESPERRELLQKKQELRTSSTQEVFNHYPELEQKLKIAQKERSLFIQGSLVVPGKTLEKFLEEAEASPNADSVIQQLDTASFSGHVLASLLLLPTDYKPDNLMVDEQNRIIGIDNDAALEADELRKLNISKKHVVSIKNILYFLPLMKLAIPTNIQERFIKVHPALFLLNWLVVLRNKQPYYDSLLNASLLDYQDIPQMKRNVQKSLGLPLQFVSGWIPSMYERLRKIQSELNNNPSITHQELFEQIHPFASRHYKSVKKLFPKPLDQIAFIYEKIPKDFNRAISNDLETLIDQFPEPGDEKLLSKLSQTPSIHVNPTLSIEQAIQEVIANVDLRSYDDAQQLAWIERVAEINIWPDSLHSSWYAPLLLIRMVKEGASESVIRALIEKANADIHVRDKAGEAVLHAAVRRAGQDALRQIPLLIKLGADKEVKAQGITPLDLAAEQEDINIFRLLIHLGAGEEAIHNKINRFYQKLPPEVKVQLIPYITTLTQINPKIGWKISLDELFPIRGNSKGTLSTVTEGERAITEEAWNQLFDKGGKPNKMATQYGVRSVPFVEKNGQRIYVKFYPQLPGTELAVIRLAENLLGYCAPYCELASIENIPVLLTQGISGQTLYEVLRNHPEKIKKLDPESVSKALILAMLINPGDGNLGNYIVSPFVDKEGKERYRLISIDNDQAFMPAVAKTIKTGIFSSTLTLQVKTVLYCLDVLEHKVNRMVINKIRGVDLVDMLGRWLSSLKIHHQAIVDHFNSNLVKKCRESKTTVLGIPFAPGMIKELFTKLMRLQTILNKKKIPTHLEVLENLEPFIAYRYKAVLNDPKLSVIEKFKKVEKINGESILTRSSNTLSQLLVSREIPELEKLQAALWSGDYGLNQVLEELRFINEQHTSMQQILEDLALGKLKRIKRLSNLPAGILETVLKEADLTKLSEPQQKSLLDVIKEQELRHVYLRNCSVIKGAILLSFKLDHITKLDLSGCPKLGTISSGLFGNSPIIMSALIDFKLDRSNIRAIRLKADSLKVMSARNCTQLESIYLIDPQPDTIDLREAVSLSSEIIESILKKFSTTFIYITPTRAFPLNKYNRVIYKLGLDYKYRGQYKLAFHYLKQAAEQGSIGAQYDIGVMYQNGQGVRKDYNEAVRWYGQSADEGYVAAQAILGVIYFTGVGGIKNYIKAIHYLEQAAYQGNIDSHNLLDMIYKKMFGLNQYYVERINWYKKIAERGDANTQNKLALIYSNGWGVSQSYEEAFKWYLKAAVQGVPTSQNIIGVMYYTGLGIKKDYKEAIKWYRKAAVQGFVDAQYNLAFMYHTGKGVRKNYKDAIKWYTKAISQGSISAQYRLGLMCENGEGMLQNYKEAIKWYLKAAEQGNRDAQYNLAFMYHTGKGVRKNYKEAIKWYTKAISQGSISAQYRLGLMYENGNGIKQDYQEAIRWYKRAAVQANMYAQYRLGLIYENGELGMWQNYKEALKWYLKAAEQGNRDAQYKLGCIYENNQLFRIDHQEAIKWYKRAAAQGSISAQYRLGCMYENGKGINRDYKEALKWYLKAAEQDSIDAQYKLGCIYENSQLFQIGYQEAIKWYKRAAAQGNISAQYRLGLIYENGNEMKQDYKEALQWYLRAAQQGHMEAQYRLGIIYENNQLFRVGYQEAIKWYKRAAAQGSISAQYRLGCIYENGNEMKQDHEEALEWYLKAARQGHMEAQYRLGIIYENKLAVIENNSEIKQAYYEIDDQEYRTNLGYKQNITITYTADYLLQKAFKWYQKAALQGHIEAGIKALELRKKLNKLYIVTIWPTLDNSFLPPPPPPPPFAPSIMV